MNWKLTGYILFIFGILSADLDVRNWQFWIPLAALVLVDLAPEPGESWL